MTKRTAPNHDTEERAEILLGHVESIGREEAARALAATSVPLADAVRALAAMSVDPRATASRRLAASILSRKTDPMTENERNIRETCALAGKPDRATAFIAAGKTPGEVRETLLAEANAPGKLIAAAKARNAAKE